MSALRDAMSHAVLGWVKPELDETLRLARGEIEAFVETPSDTSRMRFCAGYLHQVQGTLRMVELYAPAMVAEELELLSQALQEGAVADRDEACSTLMRGAVLLPDYLERLQDGHRDIPIVLLPLLNDIRAARGATVLNESMLFPPGTQPEPGSEPTAAEIDHARSSLSGRNRELLDTVGNAVKEELLRVKDALDLHLRTRDNPAGLQQQVGELGNVADTLGMMGLGVARDVVLQQRDALREVAEGTREADEGTLLDIAGALLYVDASLDDQVARLGGPAAEGGADASRVESQRTVEILAQEAIINFAAAREKFVAFIETNWNHGELAEVPRLLDEVAGAMRMLELEQAADYVTGVRRYVSTELIGKQRIPGGQQLDTLADALASLEYFLEALRERRPNREDILEITRNSLENLRYWPLPAEIIEVAPSVAAPIASAPAVAAPVASVPPPLPPSLPVTPVIMEGIERAPDSTSARPSATEERNPFDPIGFEYEEEAPAAAAASEFSTDTPIDMSTDTPVDWNSAELSPAPLETARESFAPEAIAENETASSESVLLETTQADAPHEVIAHDEAAAAFADIQAAAAAFRIDADEPPVEASAPAAAPFVSTSSSAIPASEGGFDSDAGDIDDEIREVFLEEFDEEIVNLRQLLPAWRNQPEDLDRLRPIRRVFHTLKGSGRLVGARTLGEFAWKVENMLNRVLDRSRAPSTAVVVLLEQVCEVLPQLNAALRGEAPIVADLEGLNSIADRIAGGEDAFYGAPEPVASDAPAVEAEEVDEFAEFDTITEQEPELAADAPTAFAPPASDAVIETTATVADETAHAFGAGIAPAISETPTAEEPVAEPVIEAPVEEEADEEGTPASVDAVLREILEAEVATHLETVRGWIARSSMVPQPVNEPLLRAMHTMNGAFAMADVPEIIEVTAPAEQYIKRLLASGNAAELDGVQALSDTAAAIQRSVDALKKRSPRIPVFAELSARLAALRDGLPDVRASHTVLDNGQKTYAGALGSGMPLPLAELHLDPHDLSAYLDPSHMPSASLEEPPLVPVMPVEHGEEAQAAPIDFAAPPPPSPLQTGGVTYFDVAYTYSLRPHEEAAPTADSVSTSSVEIDTTPEPAFIEDSAPVFTTETGDAPLTFAEGELSVDHDDALVIEEISLEGDELLAGESPGETGVREEDAARADTIALDGGPQLADDAFVAATLDVPAFQDAVPPNEAIDEATASAIAIDERASFDANDSEAAVEPEDAVAGITSLELASDIDASNGSATTDEAALEAELPDGDADVDSVEAMTLSPLDVEATTTDETMIDPASLLLSADLDEAVVEAPLSDTSAEPEIGTAATDETVPTDAGLELTEEPVLDVTAMDIGLDESPSATLSESDVEATADALAESDTGAETAQVPDTTLAAFDANEVEAQPEQDAASSSVTEVAGETDEPSEVIETLDAIEAIESAPIEQIEEVQPATEEIEVAQVESAHVESPQLETQQLETQQIDAAEHDTVAALEAQPEDALDLSGLDLDLVEIFIEEGNDLLDHSDDLLAKLRETPEDRSLVTSLQRDLHTLKGGARMAGIHAVGDLGHAIESMLESIVTQRTELDMRGIVLLERGFDALHDQIKRVDSRLSVGVPDGLIAEFNAHARGIELPQRAASEPQEKKPVTLAPLSAPVETTDAAPEEEGAPHGQQEQVRVRADLLDRLVNHAGEVAIYRARLEQQLGAFRGAMAELERTNVRLHDQLRRLDLETEAQIVARYQREQEHQDAVFDPLELDRFSTLQQLSRGLAESAADISGLQGVLDDLARNYDSLLHQQSRVSSELQEELMRARMVPFEGIVPRLRRVLRQAATDTGKQARLLLEGTHGEMDRNVLERMTAPLEHLLRNSVAHGLEAPETRAAAGKPEEGTVIVSLRREGSEMVLQVRDDGAGLNRAAIRARAEKRGLLQSDAVIDDIDLDRLILESGFSTYDSVSQLAGRGVGMDVVYNEVRQLGGTLDISSTPGEGALFTLRLPQTLAVTQAAFVQMGETQFAVPVASVSGIGRISRERFESAGGSYHYGGEDYTLYNLGGLIGQAAARAEGQPQVPLLLIRAGDMRAAVAVDQVLGNQEIVVKPVGPQIASIPGIYGATITGDGSVVVILDIAPLVRRYQAQPQQPESAEPAPEQRHVPLVMVVDDSLTMRKVTSRVLERHNFDVTAARDGVEALERLEDRVPDLMLLDIEMPRMDGYELATAMKADARFRDVPIVMITSRTGDKHRQRAFDIGVQRYMGKPYQELDLMRNVYDLLGIARVRE